MTFNYTPPLRPHFPEVKGCQEYLDRCAFLTRMDTIIAEAGLDQIFLELAVKDRSFPTETASPARRTRFMRFTGLCLRANILRTYLKAPHREFCTIIAQTPIYQWFLQVSEVDGAKVFGKSSSERFEKWVSLESMREMHDHLIGKCCAGPETAPVAPFNLEEHINATEVYFDTFCQDANIHFPTDWVLLRDAARTLMKATLCIRRAGLLERMPQAPELFLKEMNILCIAMTNQRRRKDSKRQRKAILRSMKKLAKRIAAHAESHREALAERWAQTKLTEGQANQIIKRIDNVLKQLPAAIKQAHERIIGGRQTESKDKILSLYDNEVNVVIRGKADAEVEFGNKCSLTENKAGLILDFKLHRDNPADSNLLQPVVKRLQGMELPVEIIFTDRGMHSKANEAFLAAEGIRSGVCPKAPLELIKKLDEPGIKEGMRRRGSTEARVAIISNIFMKSADRGKSVATREMAFSWAVITHNLWVVARLKQKKAAEKPAGDATDEKPRTGSAQEQQAA